MCVCSHARPFVRPTTCEIGAILVACRCLQGPVLKERIIGQDDAVEAVVSALCRWDSPWTA